MITLSNEELRFFYKKTIEEKINILLQKNIIYEKKKNHQNNDFSPIREDFILDEEYIASQNRFYPNQDILNTIAIQLIDFLNNTKEIVINDYAESLLEKTNQKLNFINGHKEKDKLINKSLKKCFKKAKFLCEINFFPIEILEAQENLYIYIESFYKYWQIQGVETNEMLLECISYCTSFNNDILSLISCKHAATFTMINDYLILKEKLHNLSKDNPINLENNLKENKHSIKNINNKYNRCISVFKQAYDCEFAIYFINKHWDKESEIFFSYLYDYLENSKTITKNHKKKDYITFINNLFKTKITRIRKNLSNKECDNFVLKYIKTDKEFERLLQK